MIRLTLSDGTRIHVNPASISYIQSLPVADPKGEKEKPKTKVVLLSGETLTVREPSGRILGAAGFAPRMPGKRKEHADEGSEE